MFCDPVAGKVNNGMSQLMQTFLGRLLPKQAEQSPVEEPKTGSTDCDSEMRSEIEMLDGASSLGKVSSFKYEGSPEALAIEARGELRGLAFEGSSEVSNESQVDDEFEHFLAELDWHIDRSFNECLSNFDTLTMSGRLNVHRESLPKQPGKLTQKDLLTPQVTGLPSVMKQQTEIGD